ncbi:MAG: ribosome assembly factor SBDS [Candidatus Micrarchaeota archaeon]|nr:ribosome assembly factor SBDS [Candidatus Micrarchaeota archaeon]MDE1834628.1 ribosome assembly factor SBDS [Candidatus Micrarchaeota archaeon]MDE1859059.1 ribosome assembly factor SBDS [Candidatus Micrarchaeota archaeon]
MSKTVVAKYNLNGEQFEIFVDSDLAYDFITGKITNPMQPLQAEEVFTDANKGDRPSQDKVKKAFGTTDIAKIAEIILKKGIVPVTTEQKNKLMEEKRKQVAQIIARNSIDPRSNAPHPVQRIESAMETSKVQIDAFKSANEQVEAVVKKINVILPIKFATAKLEVIVPAEFANRCYGLLKQYGLKTEEWQSNGSLKAVLEFPAGLQGEFFEKLNNFTKGSAITKSLV